jgi:hypothetical protein
MIEDYFYGVRFSFLHKISIRKQFISLLLHNQPIIGDYLIEICRNLCFLFELLSVLKSYNIGTLSQANTQ